MARAAGTSVHRISLVAFGVLLAAALQLLSGGANAGSVRPDLEARLATLAPGDFVPVIVELTTQANAGAAASAAADSSRRGRGRAVVDALRDVADRTQPPVRAMLAQEQAAGAARRLTPFWVFNGLAVEATEPAVRRLAARNDVREVRLDATIRPPVPRPTSISPSSAQPAWNIEVIRAPEAWALGAGYTGAGIVIGSFDTGVDGLHPDLALRYRGDHAISWFDPYHQHATPFDGIGHGTHTVGTMLGGDLSGYSIGVAPGARWIAAKAWNNNGEGTESAFHEIFQWFLAPGGDPANAPHIVNNSWGMDSTLCITEFRADVQAFRAAGIVPIFASGNSGPDPGTVLSPGAYAESFTVGATDYFDDIAFFSSQGPSSCDGIMKPNISAPGVVILSTFPGGDYAYLDGTSMATPHVSGAAAVLLSIAPDLTVEEVEAVLVSGAVDLGPAGPDNAFGYGRLDLMESATIALASSGAPVVGITATTPSVMEAGGIPGAFTVRRSGDTAAALTLTYTVAGTATPGIDYVALPGSVEIPAGVASVVIPVTPIDDALGELDETVVVKLDTSPAYIAAPRQASVTIVSEELPPDFMVTAVSAPSGAGAGSTISVTDTTRNVGAGPAAPSSTRLHLSADPTLDASDVVLGARTVPGLAPGAGDSGSVTVTIPAATTAGTYWIIAKADGDEAQLEADESNNLQTTIVRIGADLAVSSFSVPTAGGAGLAIVLADTTTNWGAGAAAATTTGFYLSADSTWDGSDILLGSRAVSALLPGAAHAASTSVTIPAGTATGNYYVVGRADAGDVVLELYENNNTINRMLAVGPDLLVPTMAAPASGGAGAMISVTDTTRNSGGGAAAASTTRFYLSSNSTLDAADLLLGGRAVPALAPGASSAAPVTLTLPAGTADGTYWLIAKADGDEAIVETQEGNNLLASMIQIGADLVVSSLTVPGDAGQGAAITLTDTTLNQGAGSAAASMTRFFLSADATLDGGDAVLGSRAVPALAAGASDTSSTTITIPAGIASGTYTLFARADAGDTVPETYETNNTTSRTLRIGADLQVSNLTAPSGAGAGAAISVTDTTRNSGGGAVASSTTRIYLSANPTLEASDTVLGSRVVPALAAGAADTGTLTLTIPPGTAGATYWLIAKADAEDAVAETLETNNVLTRTIIIGTDLAISSFSVPSVAGAGQAITLTDSTSNQGAGAAVATTTTFYLSTDTTVGASDVVLGSRAVPALAAGMSDTASTTVTIPAATATGIHYVIARSDSGDAVSEISETNNTMHRMLGVGPDLLVASLVAPAGAGAGATISVTDTTRNTGGGAAAASVTRFHLSANSVLDAGDLLLGSRAVPALAAGASNAAPATLAIPAGTAAGTYYLFAVADGEAAVAETEENNNAFFALVQIGADLTVASLTVPTDAGAGLAMTLSDTTKNQGAGTAAASMTRFLLSADATLDAGDIVLGSRTVPALGAGASDTGSATVTIPAGTATGAYYVFARVDADDAIPETYETNNVTSRSLRVGPDLVVASLAAPATAGTGASISVADTTRNAGGGGIGASTTRFYLSADPTLDASDIVLGNRAIPALAPGVSDTGSLALTIPASVAAGTYWLIARADGDDALVETQESNNLQSRIVTIGADLAISSLTGPSNAGAGLAMTLTDATKNQGGGAANASTTTFYLSANTTFDSSDIVLGSRAVPALAGGASHSASTTVTIPAGTATGTHFVIARADAGDAIAELSEANNTLSWTLVVGPDLQVSNLTVPATAGAGTTVSATDTTRNAGGGNAAASTTRFYLSANSSLDTGDVLLGARAVAALAAGASNTGSVTFAIPADTVGGTYSIIARADADDALVETQEGNNVLARSVVIGGDLAVTAFTAPADGGAGLAITLTDKTKNQSAGAAGASTTTFHLSANWALDAADILLGSRAVPALAAGASDTGSITVTIPAGTATATYYLIARADGGDVVPEVYENNNTLSRTVRIGPDLTVASLTAPSSAGAGTTIAVSDTTRNSGGGAAAASITRLHLSADPTLDAGDVVLGTRAIAALAPGASDTASVAVTIPAGIAAGTYWIIARADGGDAVAETQETNNLQTRTLQVGADLAISSFSVPTAAGAGRDITLADTTRNQGAGAAGPTTTTFYLSTDTTVSASDVVLASRTVPALDGGASDSASTLVTIPALTATGVYYVIARADATGVVGELSETNNTMSRMLAVGPDLLVYNMTAPPSAVAGSVISVSSTTRNSGAGDAGPSTTRFHLSANWILDAGDILLGGLAIPALAAGTSSAGPFTLTIPAGTAPGAYYLFAVADGEAVVAETEENNNRLFANIQVTAP